MAKYSELTDYTDPALSMNESFLDAADVFIDAQLFERGINPADVVLPQMLLTQISINWAKRLACIEQARDENSPLIPKAREYEKTVNALLVSLNRTALGVPFPTGTSYAGFSAGRA